MHCTGKYFQPPNIPIALLANIDPIKYQGLELKSEKILRVKDEKSEDSAQKQKYLYCQEKQNCLRSFPQVF